MPSLTILNGDQSGTQFVLSIRPLAIGRDPSRDIQVTDPKVSRKHAMVRHDEGNYMIAPSTKALNGVVVNGDAIEDEARLRHGDIITLGETDLQFTMSDDAGQTDAVHRRKDAARENRDQNTIM
jgi:pSer/pThr/pTyr-binding forkhead associated (FHA) protein